MRRLIYIFFLTATLSVIAGCDAEDLSSTEPAGMSLVDEVLFEVVTPFNRAAELVDFYSRYRDGRSNSDFVNTLRLEYFGDTVPFSEYGNDGIEVEWWGTVELDEDGETYIVTLDPHWMGLSTTYNISVSAPRAYHIEYDSERNLAQTVEKGYSLTLEADVHIEDHFVCADRFVFYYDGSLLGFNALVRAGQGDEMLMFRLCRAGEFVNYPVSGVLYWSVSGNGLNNFSIVFYEDYFEVIEAEEIAADTASR